MRIWKIIAVIFLMYGVQGYSQQIIQWNYNGGANALGSGCNNGDTDFIEAGNEMSVIFSNLGVELSGWAGGKRLAKKTCRLIIPTKVRAGYYMAKLRQTMTYGYNRTAGTDGKISVVSKFYDQAAGYILRNVPTPGKDLWDEPWLEAQTSSNWLVRPGWCRRSDYMGNFKANLSVTGYRRSTNQDIVIQIDGHDIRFDAMGTPLLCP